MNYIPIWHKIKIDKPLAACYVTEIGFIALSYKTKYVNIPNYYVSNVYFEINSVLRCRLLKAF